MRKKKSFSNISPYFGIIGIFLIVFAEITNFFKIEPFVYWFIAMIWYGYILIVDSAVYLLKGNSYIINRPKKFIVLLILSTFFWFIFEIYNLFLKGWYYVNVPERPITCIPCWFAISTILPAVMETTELIRALRLFKKTKIEKIKISNTLLYSSIFIGFLFIIIPLLYPSKYMWFLVWSGFILLLDPINYLFHEKSLFKQLKSGKLSILLSLFIAGYLCGVLWEFWNYWAFTKWYYSVPILDKFKLFEIPFLGFFAYGFFAWELYVMYYFAKLLFPKELERELELR